MVWLSLLLLCFVGTHCEKTWSDGGSVWGEEAAASTCYLQEISLSEVSYAWWLQYHNSRVEMARNKSAWVINHNSMASNTVT